MGRAMGIAGLQQPPMGGGGHQKMTRRSHRGKWSAGRKALPRNYLAPLLGNSEGEVVVLAAFG